jgi:hypothetical protein
VRDQTVRTSEKYWRPQLITKKKYYAENIPSVYDKVKVDLQGVAGGKSEKKVVG